MWTRRPEKEERRNYLTEEIVMNKEDLLRDIGNGVREFTDKVLEDFSLEDIKCERLMFENCTFRNMKLVCNRIDWMECEECSIIDSEISGNLQEILLVFSNTEFRKCRIHNLDMNGFTYQSEIIDCRFEDCIFERLNIHADLAFLGGEMNRCTGKNLECFMHEVFHMLFTEDKFEDVSINAAVMKNKFNRVEIQNLKHIDMGEEPVWKDNKFEECIINGEVRDGE